MRSNTLRETAILLFALALPSLGTWLYFVALAGPPDQVNPLMRLVFTLGKVVQFGFPVLYVWLVGEWGKQWNHFPQPLPQNGEGEREDEILRAGHGSLTPNPERSPAERGQRPQRGEGRQKISSPPKNWFHLVLALAFGLLTLGGILGLYHLVLRNSSFLASTPAHVWQKLQEFGATTPLRYLFLAAFIALLHSFLEEYYWRWFIFGRLRQLLSFTAAVLISSLGFMAHHVIILAIYFPGEVFTIVIPFSLGIAVGGAVWAWLYQRSGSLLGPWLSHLVVDVAIMIVGYDLVATRMAGV